MQEEATQTDVWLQGLGQAPAALPMAAPPAVQLAAPAAAASPAAAAARRGGPPASAVRIAGAAPLHGAAAAVEALPLPPMAAPFAAAALVGAGHVAVQQQELVRAFRGTPANSGGPRGLLFGPRPLAEPGGRVVRSLFMSPGTPAAHDAAAPIGLSPADSVPTPFSARPLRATPHSGPRKASATRAGHAPLWAPTMGAERLHLSPSLAYVPGSGIGPRRDPAGGRSYGAVSAQAGPSRFGLAVASSQQEDGATDAGTADAAPEAAGTGVATGSIDIPNDAAGAHPASPSEHRVDGAADDAAAGRGSDALQLAAESGARRLAPSLAAAMSPAATRLLAASCLGSPATAAAAAAGYELLPPPHTAAAPTAHAGRKAAVASPARAAASCLFFPAPTASSFAATGMQAAASSPAAAVAAAVLAATGPAAIPARFYPPSARDAVVAALAADAYDQLAAENGGLAAPGVVAGAAAGLYATEWGPTSQDSGPVTVSQQLLLSLSPAMQRYAPPCLLLSQKQLPGGHASPAAASHFPPETMAPESTGCLLRGQGAVAGDHCAQGAADEEPAPANSRAAHTAAQRAGNGAVRPMSEMLRRFMQQD